MAELSITNQVHDNVLVEPLTVLCRCFESKANVLDAICVNMEYRSTDGLGNVCRVVSTSSLLRCGRESNLVVTNDMDSASHRIVLQALHLETFVNHSLACKRCISVNQDWNQLGSVGFATFRVSYVVFSSASTHRDGVDALQVRWVCQDFDSELLSIFISFGVTCSQVVLDVS